MHKTDKPMKKGKELAKFYGIEARSAHSHRQGLWYWNLKEFPAAYFDSNGVVIFQTEGEYRGCPKLTVYDKNTQVFDGGIKNIRGYRTLVPRRFRFKKLNWSRPWRDGLGAESYAQVTPHC